MRTHREKYRVNTRIRRSTEGVWDCDTFYQCFKNRTWSGGPTSRAIDRWPFWFSSLFWADYQLDQCWTAWADCWTVELLRSGDSRRTERFNTPGLFWLSGPLLHDPTIIVYHFIFYFYKMGFSPWLNIKYPPNLAKWAPLLKYHAIRPTNHFA